MPHNSPFPAFGLRRRHLLGGFLAASAVSVTPWAISAATAPGTTASAAFMALSQYLTERNDLSPKLAARMQAAWQALDDKFSANVDALWKWIESSNVALAELNTRLQAEQPDLAKVPAQIMQIWWSGIAGSGNAVRVVTYEYALNAEAVAHKLRPPSYVYGSYGSWTSNPTTFDIKLTNVLAA